MAKGEGETRIKVTEAEGDAFAEVLTEYKKASSKHGAFNSAHEGWAVLYEEVDELWDEVKHRHRDTLRMRAEAMQIAAMAIRFMVDVCN